MKKNIYGVVLLAIVLFLFSGCGTKLDYVLITSNERIFVGDSYELKVNGYPTDADVKIQKWESSDSNVIRVDDKGVVTGIGVGNAFVIVYVDGIDPTYKSITVYNHTESIKLDNQELKLKPNETQQLNVTIIPDKNEFHYKSNDNSIATVFDDGMIKAVNYGKTDIVVSAYDNVEAICSVTVSVIVPDFNLMSKSDAEKWGADNLITVKTSTSYSDNFDSGEVISQSIEAGTEIEESGKEIEIIYSLGHKATLGESNALSKARDYLKYTAFSAKSLKEQLEYEGYSSSEAQYGVDNCGADWNEQAAKKAQSYMEYMSFSRKRLKEQLLYEGFSNEQAEYGVTSVGY